MKKIREYNLNRVGFITFGRNVYFKKGKHTLNLLYFVERFLNAKPYAKSR